MPNRLIHETSPYLQQHAHNPVDWYPWSEEALKRASDEDRPIFLSVGYSTCHWCHVMEHESFENDAIAEVLNRLFVPIKVDREERPDLDDIYMKATQLMSGQGGWPNSVWLTPDGRPFHAGTYFPPEDRGGRPGFRTVLETLGRFWTDRRDEIETQADRLAESIRKMSGGDDTARTSGTVRGLEPGLIERAIENLEDAYDRQHGGFGGAPKFPPHGSLRLLLAELERNPSPSLERIVTGTLDAMANGGIRDHVGGGFHRYATDGHWFLPHFEKMLYDNAQLLSAYSTAHSRWPDRGYDRICDEIVDWVTREMVHSEGGFYSALDADSEGEEGKFYVWRHSEILEVLGKDAGADYCRVYGVIPEGNFHDEATGERHDTCIPFLPGGCDPTMIDQLQAANRKLLQSRANRVRPHLDDKVLTSWNGLMIGALAYAGRALARPAYVNLAERAAAFLRGVVGEGPLHRSWRDGKTTGSGFLDDYSYLADGLVELYRTTENEEYLTWATRLMERVLGDFHDERGGFYSTSSTHEVLIARSSSPYDEAIPSGNGVAARVLVRLYQESGEVRYRDRARQVLETYTAEMRRASRGTEALTVAAFEFLQQEARERATTESWGDALAEDSPVRAIVYLSTLSVAVESDFQCAIQLRIDPGYVVAQNDLLVSVAGASVESSDDPIAEDTGFAGETWWYRTLSFTEGEGPRILKVEVTATPCTDDSASAPACLPEKRLALEVPVLISPATSSRSRYPDVFAD